MDSLSCMFHNRDCFLMFLFPFVSFIFGLLSGWLVWGKRASDMVSEMTGYKLKATKAQTELDGFKTKFDAQDAELKQWKTTAEEFKSKIYSIQEEKNALTKELEGSSKVSDVYESEKNTYQAIIQDLNNQIMEFKAAKTTFDPSEAQIELDTAHTQIESLKGEIEALRETIAQHEEEKASIGQSFAIASNRTDDDSQEENAQIDALKAEIATLKEIIEQNSHENAKKADEIAEHGANSIQLQNEINALKTQLEAKKAAEIALDEQKAAKNQLLVTQLHDEQQKIIQLEAEIVSLQTSLEKSLTVAESTPTDVIQLEALKTENENLKTNLADLTLIHTEKESIQHAYNDLRTLHHQDIADNQDRIKALEMEINGLQEKIKKYEGQSSLSMRFASAPTVSTIISKDDLKRVEGIGPKIEKLLNDNGILTFSQLANTSIDTLRALLEDAGPRFKMHDPATWCEQAQLAANGEWEALELLQQQNNK